MSFIILKRERKYCTCFLKHVIIILQSLSTVILHFLKLLTHRTKNTYNYMHYMTQLCLSVQFSLIIIHRVREARYTVIHDAISIWRAALQFVVFISQLLQEVSVESAHTACKKTTEITMNSNFVEKPIWYSPKFINLSSVKCTKHKTKLWMKLSGTYPTIIFISSFRMPSSFGTPCRLGVERFTKPTVRFISQLQGDGFGSVRYLLLFFL